MTLQKTKSTTLNTETGLPIRFLREYDGAAEHYAKNSELPQCMGSPGALDWIQADPEAFEQRVREFKYANAMEAIHRKFETPTGKSLLKQTPWNTSPPQPDEPEAPHMATYVVNDRLVRAKSYEDARRISAQPETAKLDAKQSATRHPKFLLQPG